MKLARRRSSPRCHRRDIGMIRLRLKNGATPTAGQFSRSARDYAKLMA